VACGNAASYPDKCIRPNAATWPDAPCICSNVRAGVTTKAGGAYAAAAAVRNRPFCEALQPLGGTCGYGREHSQRGVGHLPAGPISHRRTLIEDHRHFVRYLCPARRVEPLTAAPAPAPGAGCRPSVLRPHMQASGLPSTSGSLCGMGPPCLWGSFDEGAKC
jgi:hypothetical protein